MVFTVGIAQTCHPADGDVVSLVERFAGEAKRNGVELLVFPESLMSRYEAEIGDFLSQSQPIGSTFTEAVDSIAKKYALWIVYTMNERNDSGALPFNTAIVVDGSGARRGVYRKVHLFDSATTCESERMSAGDELFLPIDTPFGRLGLAICYDLRFPEVSREAAIRGCDIMVYPAAWVDGPNKAVQWDTLLAARAIENAMFVVGACRADDSYIGRSVVFGPNGSVCARGGAAEELVVARLDSEDLDRMRAAIPSLSHRRPDVYLRGSGASGA